MAPARPWSHNSLFTSWPSCARSPGQRTDEELDLIFEELLHIKAVAHLSNSVSPRPPRDSPEPPAAGPEDTSLPGHL